MKDKAEIPAKHLKNTETTRMSNRVPEKQGQHRQAALNRLSRHAMESGLYEKSKFPKGGRDE